MTAVEDVAAYILKKTGRIPAVKLQKLVYYSQAWSLVWDDEPLFEARIEAWANGPVVPHLYAKHRLRYEVGPKDLNGHPERLTNDQRETIDAVVGFYGNKSSQWLSDLTHNEDPWQEARQGIKEGERSNAVISLRSMAEYYSSLEGDD